MYIQIHVCTQTHTHTHTHTHTPAQTGVAMPAARRAASSPAYEFTTNTLATH